MKKYLSSISDAFIARLLPATLLHSNYGAALHLVQAGYVIKRYCIKYDNDKYSKYIKADLRIVLYVKALCYNGIRLCCIGLYYDMGTFSPYAHRSYRITREHFIKWFVKLSKQFA